MQNQEIFFPIVVGITSSLVATAIFVVFSEVVRRILLPWFADKIYRGVRIDGSWSCDHNETMTLDLKQWGEKLTGYYSHEDDTGKEIYKISGVLKNMYFMGIMEPLSNKHIDAGSLLMHVDDDKGLTLKGSILHKDNNKVGVWERVEFKLNIPNTN